jgi:hypothetical protein
MALRLTIVGGGSYQWAPKLLVDFANTPLLHDAEIVIQDIDPCRFAHGRVRRASSPPWRHRHDRDRNDRPTAGARRRRLRHREHLHRRVRLDALTTCGARRTA